MTMAAPARIALVASTLGRPSAEGETMRLVGPIVGVALVIIVLGVLIGRAGRRLMPAACLSGRGGFPWKKEDSFE